MKIYGNTCVVITGQIAATMVMMIYVKLHVSLGKLFVLIRSLFAAYVAAPMSSAIIYYDWYKRILPKIALYGQDQDDSGYCGDEEAVDDSQYDGVKK